MASSLTPGPLHPRWMEKMQELGWASPPSAGSRCELQPPARTAELTGRFHLRARCLLSPEGSGMGQEGGRAFSNVPGSDINKKASRAAEHPDVFLPYLCLFSLSPGLFSRQNLLQPPLQLRGHAGDHTALRRLPRGCPWPAGRRCLLPRGVRPGALCPRWGTGKPRGWTGGGGAKAGITLGFCLFNCSKIYIT